MLSYFHELTFTSVIMSRIHTGTYAFLEASGLKISPLASSSLLAKIFVFAFYIITFAFSFYSKIRSLLEFISIYAT